MELGISKERIQVNAGKWLNYYGGMIAGAGVGMLLAIAFIPEDDRRIFKFHYFVTSGILILVGICLASFQLKKQVNDSTNDKHVV